MSTATLSLIKSISPEKPENPEKSVGTIKKAEGFESRESIIKYRQFKFQQHRDYLKKDFSLSPRADDIEYEGYAPLLDTDCSAILLQGWLGAGKTQAALNSLAEMASVMPVIWIAPRNLLLSDTERRAEEIFLKLLAKKLIRQGVPVHHYQDDIQRNKDYIRTGQPGLYCMCGESLKDHTDEHLKWDRAILVIDEFRGIRSEILKRPAEFKNFQRGLAEASKLIVIDAFLSDVDVAILKRFRPENFSDGKVRIYRQKFEKSVKLITWLECLTKDKTNPTISFSHEGLYFTLLSQWVENGVGKFCIASDNKRTAKVLKIYLESLGRKPLLISADSPSASIEFMRNPDQSWQQGDWDVLIYTPTIQSGADIQSHFDRGLLIATGVLSPVQMMQMLGRCRQCQHWYVSAPRMSVDPASPSALNAQKLRQGTWKQQKAWDKLDQPYSSASTAWELHEAAVSDVEKAYNSEYLRALLEEYFEQVSVEFVSDPTVAQFRSAVQESKRSDAILEMGADLKRGEEMLLKRQNPTNDLDLWSKRLATQIERMPEIEDFVSGYKAAIQEDTEESRVTADELVSIYLTLTNERIDRLKNWVMAQDDEECETVLAELYELQRSDQIVYNSSLAKTYRNLRLWKELNLKELPRLTSTKDDIAHETMFHISSPVIIELWERFKKHNWHDCFPLLETLGDFFVALKRCLKFMGFQQYGKYIRIETDELHPNGKDRKGNQRYSKSKPMYFVGWYIMENSGNAMFKEWFPKIMECVRGMALRDSDRRQERIDKKRGYGTPEDCLSPPSLASPPEHSLPFEVGQQVQDLVTGFSGVVTEIRGSEFLLDGASIFVWRTADKIAV